MKDVNIIGREQVTMPRTVDDFQIFAKPAGYRCNLRCSYCYYLKTEHHLPRTPPPRMTDDLLETYIRGHIAAYPGTTVRFSWHGGEPTLLGLDYFRRIVRLQKKHCPPHQRIANGVQTNGTLLDEEWARFLAKHRFSVGLSLDGPRELHDLYRLTGQGLGSHDAVMRGYAHLVRHRVPTDILCVVNADNVMFPLQVYRFFTAIGAKHLSFLPLVERVGGGVSDRSVPAEAFGAFLCTIFDAWVAEDIGTIKIQIFEEAARTAFGQDHSLCLFRQTCGDIPVIEHNGEVFACDHFVEPAWRVGNVKDTPLAEILAGEGLTAFGEAKRRTLPSSCRSCPVLAMCNGECPKNRFVESAGETEKLNYLCSGYRLFFSHCTPFIQAITLQWQHPAEPGRQAAGATGRNQPCPCGSGRKHKKCCDR